MPTDPRYFITLLRQGESVGNGERRIQGQAGFPLTETGRAQASASSFMKNIFGIACREIPVRGAA
jgi:bisphosphoglycerate-dependent phosphoglycerate mutase